MNQKKPVKKRGFVSFAIIAISLIVIFAVAFSILPSKTVTVFNVPPGEIETETANLNSGGTFTGSFAVSGGSGNDVNFWITDPQGVTILNDGRVSQGTTFDITAQQSGAYTLHFDNSFSIISTKTVDLSYSIGLALFGISLGFLLTILAVIIATVMVVIFALMILAVVMRHRISPPPPPKA